MPACTKSGFIRNEEIDHLRHFFRFAGFSAGKKCIFFLPALLNSLVVFLTKCFKEVVNKRSMDSSRTDSVDTNIILCQINGKASSYLPYCPFGHTIGETMSFTYEELVR